MIYEYAYLYYGVYEAKFLLQTEDETVPIEGCAYEIIKVLNNLGRKGWRVIQRAENGYYYLERKIK